MPGGVQEHPDVLLRLVVGQLGAQRDGTGNRGCSRSVTSKSRCSIICWLPGVAGQTGRT